MTFSPGTTLRWAGAVCLAIAVGMVVAGETFLRERLRAEAFLYYWLVCIIFTFLTMMIALLDFWIVRRRARHEQAELLRQTLRTIAQEGGISEEELNPDGRGNPDH